MKERVAIFVDWDNLRYLLQNIKRQHKEIQVFDFNNPSHLTQLFNNFLENNESLYRIFFYTAKPLSDDEIRAQLRNREREAFDEYVDKRNSSIFDIATHFLAEIVKEPYIALRCGVLKVRGMKQGKPDIVQKQVDMLMGLDISEVTFNKHAQKVIIFSKDTDMKPALKMARINGLEVIIANFKEKDYLAPKLILHSDIVRTKSLKELDDNLKKNICFI
ncbi:MAG: NYN domain-containing protein [Sulfurovum sp.]|nr:NYN domain-containing protein [Sulfurovum sp.]